MAFRLVILLAFSGFVNLISFDEAVSQFLGPAVFRGFLGGCDSWSIVFVHGQVLLETSLSSISFPVASCCFCISSCKAISCGVERALSVAALLVSFCR